ncbi:hypothetical protein [Sphingomonas trueperi]|uniref:Uncharacterized protein n=1 Tax=Sphingomonas trueperi TaxID=53317 RepID=A0A7X5Y4Z4_9SPHN|nr:hypothetical protein [Sphingomonas trueperi]NJB99860.1 hypothetical protein [Sphingomonas trueperi]
MSTVADFATAAISATAGVVGTLIIRRGQGRDTDRTVDAQLEEHRDGMMLDLLRAAREERAAMQADLERWRAIAAHLDDFDLALSHIEALLAAETENERASVARSAHAFLGRIEVKRRAQQQVRAEAQLGVSVAGLNEQAKKGS